MFFHMYIAPGQGQTTLCGQNPDVNRKALSDQPGHPISLESDFIHNFSSIYERTQFGFDWPSGFGEEDL